MKNIFVVVTEYLKHNVNHKYIFVDAIQASMTVMLNIMYVYVMMKIHINVKLLFINHILLIMTQNNGVII